MPPPTHSGSRTLVLCIAAVLAAGGCGRSPAVTSLPAPSPSSVPAGGGPVAADNSVEGEMTRLAAVVDRGFEDGWFVGRDPRIFKSPYRSVAPADKARFALAYRRFLEKSGQDMERDVKSYVPYRRRAEFAGAWWADDKSYGRQYAGETRKLQVVWIHEALLDGSELWWRVHERQAQEPITSGQVLAHDVEQDMVSQYMEDERTPGSLATQLK